MCQSKQPFGSKLTDGKAHEQHHDAFSRRSFLTQLGLAGGAGLMLGSLPIEALKASPLTTALAMNETDRVLVLLRLKGGNDGLNTIIPLADYSTYSNARPTLAIPTNNITNITPEVGISNDFAGFLDLWQQDGMKVVQGVGYEDQNLSHFRSSDIWASATEADEFVQTGWLGRYLENQLPDYLQSPPENPPAIQIGGPNNLIFNSAATNMAMVLNDPEELYRIAQNGSLYDVNDLPDCSYGEELGFLRAIANTTVTYAEKINEAFENASNTVEYDSENPIAQQLSVVARLIKGQLGTQIYMVSLDGFDTHAEQADYHPQLMRWISDATKDFYTDLNENDWDQRVLTMTFSEFGRRVEENASTGTDHGAAAPVLLFGKDVDGSGVIGNHPSLTNLDDAGNMIHSTDFKQIYATVLEDWLCIDAALVDTILGQSVNRIDGLVKSCKDISSSIQDAVFSGVAHELRYRDAKTPFVHLQLAQSGSVQLKVLDLTGKQVHSNRWPFVLSGNQNIDLLPSNKRLMAGPYIYQIQTSGQTVSGKFVIR